MRLFCLFSCLFVCTDWDNIFVASSHRAKWLNFQPKPPGEKVPQRGEVFGRRYGNGWHSRRANKFVMITTLDQWKVYMGSNPPLVLRGQDFQCPQNIWTSKITKFDMLTHQVQAINWHIVHHIPPLPKAGDPKSKIFHRHGIYIPTIGLSSTAFVKLTDNIYIMGWR